MYNKRGKANWIGHSWRTDCLLNHVNEGKVEGRIEATRRRRRKSKQLYDDIKKTRVSCKLKGETLDHTVCRTRFGRGYGPVLRLTAE